MYLEHGSFSSKILVSCVIWNTQASPTCYAAAWLGQRMPQLPEVLQCLIPRASGQHFTSDFTAAGHRLGEVMEHGLQPNGCTLSTIPRNANELGVRSSGLKYQNQIFNQNYGFAFLRWLPVTSGLQRFLSLILSLTPPNLQPVLGHLNHPSCEGLFDNQAYVQ